MLNLIVASLVFKDAFNGLIIRIYFKFSIINAYGVPPEAFSPAGF